MDLQNITKISVHASFLIQKANDTLLDFEKKNNKISAIVGPMLEVRLVGKQKAIDIHWGGVGPNMSNSIPVAVRNLPFLLLVVH